MMKRFVHILIVLLMTTPSCASWERPPRWVEEQRIWNPKDPENKGFWLHDLLPHLPLDELMILYNARKQMVDEPDTSSVKQLMRTMNTYQTVLRYFFSVALREQINSPVVLIAEEKIRNGSTLREQLAQNFPYRNLRGVSSNEFSQALRLKQEALENRELHELARLRFMYDPCPWKGALPTIYAYLHSSTNGELLWTTEKIQNSFGDNYLFTGVKVTEVAGSQDQLNITVSLKKKIVEIGVPDTWQELSLHTVHEPQWNRPWCLEFQFTDLRLALKTPDYPDGLWPMKDVWSLQEMLRLSLRIPRPDENWIGYLAHYYRNNLHPALVARESQPFLAHLRQKYSNEKFYYNNAGCLKILDDLCEALRQQDCFALRNQLRDQIRMLQAFPSCNIFVSIHEYFYLQSDLYRPPPMIQALLDKHEFFRKRYDSCLRCYLVRGCYNHDSSCNAFANITPAQYVHRVMNIQMYFDECESQERSLIQALCEAQREPRPATFPDPAGFWQARYGFPAQHAVGLFLLESLGDVGLDADNLNLSSLRLDRLLNTYYSHCRPFEIPTCIPQRFHSFYLQQVMSPCSLCLSRMNHPELGLTLVKIQQAAETFIDESVKRSRRFPFLSEALMEEALFNYVFKGDDSRLAEGLLSFCRQRQVMFPNLTAHAPANPRYGDARRLQREAARWIYENDQGTATFGEAYGAFLTMLQEKYDALVEIGIFNPEQCQFIVYRSQVHDKVRSKDAFLNAIKRVLRKNPETWKASYASSLVLIKNPLALRGRYLETLAETIASQSERTTYEEVERKARARWLTQELKNSKLHLPPHMIRDIVQRMTQEEPLSLDRAIIQQLPAMYEALLGSGLTFKLSEDLERHVAEDLLRGKSFGMCHRLNFPLTTAGWLSVVLRMMNIPVEDYNLAPDEYNLKSVETFITDLDRSRVQDIDLWKLAPYEVICRFRKANKLVPLSSRPVLEQRQQRYKEGRRAAEERHRQAQSKIFPGLLPRYHPLGTYISNAFHGGQMACRKDIASFNFLIRENRLLLDAYLKTSPIELLVPKEVTDEEYNHMRDTLTGIAMCHMIWERAAASPDGTTTEEDWRDSERACYFIERFFRMAIKNTDYFLNDTPTEPDPWLRRRVANVYNQVFKPLIENQNYEEVYNRLQTIIQNCNTCIDSARQTLVLMEDHPQMMPVGSAPDVFERLARILRNLRLDILRKRAESHPNLSKLNDPLEFYLYMCNAYNDALSLGLEYTEQVYYGVLGYNEHIAREDGEFFWREYNRRIIETVIRAVRTRNKPAGDNDPTVLYMDDILGWAVHSKHYYNEPNLDEALVQGGQLRYKAARDLLEDAGYIKDIRWG